MLAAGNFGVERVETLLPLISIWRQPAVDLGQWLGAEAVDAELPIVANIDQASVPQHPQVA